MSEPNPERWEGAVAALRRAAFLLERSGADRYRPRAFRRAAATLEQAGPDRVLALHAQGRLTDLASVGEKSAGVARDVLNGVEPAYLARLEADLALPPASGPGALLRAALRGDLHAHTDASDGTTPMQEMVLAALDLGQEYLAITDHSPRLRVANGLSVDRLRAQIAQVRALDRAVAPFRVLTGIEVDILDDGGLDQEGGLLAELDVVVASVHSSLRMDRRAMTRRLLAAVANPNVDVLGHCTGRKIAGRLRPPSEFDARAVFDACAHAGVAVEINAQPERQDPPDDLLALARDAGCLFAIDSDAHAPGELEWKASACERAAALGVEAERVVTTWSAERLLGRGRPDAAVGRTLGGR